MGSVVRAVLEFFELRHSRFCNNTSSHHILIELQSELYPVDYTQFPTILLSQISPTATTTPFPSIMAKTKPNDRSKRSKKNSKATTNGTSSKKASPSPSALLAEALAHLHTSQPSDALICARRALAALQPAGTQPTLASLPALTLLGEINVELGEVDTARQFFLRAVTLDPAGEVGESAGGGAEKFLWLAQLCEEGGAESVGWFEKGAVALKREIGELEGKKGQEVQEAVEEKKRKLADALCGVAEVYMTDLS